MRKRLKIRLIIGTSILIAGLARAGLTKAGIIPNWFNIDALYDCIDCKGNHFFEGVSPKIEGKKCCNGTYSVEKRDCTRFGSTCPVSHI